jgi:hypothetical protein
MTKRSAPSSPAIKQPASKKQKTIDKPSLAVTTIANPQVPDPTAIAQPKPIGQNDVKTVDAADAPEVDAPVSPPVKTTKGKKMAKKERKPRKEPKPKKEPKAKEVKVRGPPKAPAVHQGFDPWKPDEADLPTPENNGWWGLKPVSGDPRPHPEQPSARKSDGATNPPMYENRGFRFKRGSRYVKYFGPIKPEGADDGPDLDQEDLLILKLIDMRAEVKGKKNAPKNEPSVPKRTTKTYFCEHGKPKDWNNMQSIKALNDRRTQAIDRVTKDAPWTRSEREYLAELFNKHPDASMWGLTELHNDYFMGKECVISTGWELSEGRTVESVRHEYVTYKPIYDQGGVPETRWSRDKSEQGERFTQKLEKKFGKPGRVAKQDGDGQAASDDEGSEDEKTPSLTKKKVTKKSPAMVKDTDMEAELTVQAAVDMAEQPKLGDDDEELLQLAGLDDPELIRTSPPREPPRNPPPKPTHWPSWSSCSSLSDVPSDLHLPGNSPVLKAKVSKAPGSLTDILALISGSPLSDCPSDLESPGDQDYKMVLASLQQESVANVVATQQPKVIEPVVVTETVLEHIIATEEHIEEQTEETTMTTDKHTVEYTMEQVREPTEVAKQPVEDQVTPIRSPPLKPVPIPRAIRDIAIDDDYDDEDEDEVLDL